VPDTRTKKLFASNLIHTNQVLLTEEAWQGIQPLLQVGLFGRPGFLFYAANSLCAYPCYAVGMNGMRAGSRSSL
jgi:hypothetical protein